VLSSYQSGLGDFCQESIPTLTKIVGGDSNEALEAIPPPED
jgi:hypothetical protein